MSTSSIVLCIAVGVLVQVYDVQSAGHCPDGRDRLAGAFCGLGPSSIVCPSGYYCNVAPNDAYAECCPTHCEHGAPLMDSFGKAVFCGRGGERCPDTYTCKIAPTDQWAVCCYN